MTTEKLPKTIAEMSPRDVDADVADLCRLRLLQGFDDDPHERWLWTGFAGLLLCYGVAGLIVPSRSAPELFIAFGLAASWRAVIVRSRDSRRAAEYFRVRERMQRRVGFDLMHALGLR